MSEPKLVLRVPAAATEPGVSSAAAPHRPVKVGDELQGKQESEEVPPPLLRRGCPAVALVLAVIVVALAVGLGVGLSRGGTDGSATVEHASVAFAVYLPGGAVADVDATVGCALRSELAAAAQVVREQRLRAAVTA